MITTKTIAKQKKRVQFAKTDFVTDSRYDHALQRARFEIDAATYKISMKSDTMFDGEKDKGDEK